MNLYDLPQLNNFKVSKPRLLENTSVSFLILVIVLSSFFGFLSGMFSSNLFENIQGYIGSKNDAYSPQTSQEQLVIKAVEQASPAVVSIVISKDVPIIEQYYTNPFGGDLFFGQGFLVPQYRQIGTQKKEVGGGTGFIISQDGMILTNKHVVADEKAEYTVLTNDGKTYPAKVLARDPFQDLALIKIDRQGQVDKQGDVELKKFPVVRLGDSDKIQMGQTVIAIGNALGEFRNTVSVGVISGLGRTITAGDSSGSLTETIEDVIQSDAAINKGNSGGPLLNLKGEVIGINTAMVQEAQSIGFSIPISKAKRAIEQVGNSGKIVYPFLGARYILVNEKIKEENKLSVDYGAWLARGDDGSPAVASGSAAEKAGLKEGDIILEFNGEKISNDNTFSKMINKYNAGDGVSLKILRSGEEKMLEAVLGQRGE